MEIIQLKCKYEHKNKKKGYERTLRFYDENGNIFSNCDVYGECMKAPTVYTSVIDSGMDFTMVAKGKILNASYFLEDKIGSRFATITRKGIGFRWKILGENNQEIARIMDPASWKEAFFCELLSGQPDSYAVVAGDQLVAIVTNEKLSKKIRQEPKNILGRFLRKVLPEVGLTLRFERDQKSKVDARMLIAGMTLLQVHDITGVNRY
jgi:hypothetical protein